MPRVGFLFTLSNDGYCYHLIDGTQFIQEATLWLAFIGNSTWFWGVQNNQSQAGEKTLRQN